MNDAALSKQPDGSYRLSGILSFDSVPPLLEQGARMFDNGSDVVLDLAQVERSDSAGLALLLEWQRLAELRQHNIILHNIPEQMLAIARVSDLDTLLPLTGN